MKTRLLILSVAALCFSVAPAMADLQDVMDDITIAPTVGASSVNAAADFLADGADSYWDITAVGASASTFVYKVENPGYEDIGTFGVFDSANPATQVQLFDGTNFVAGAQVFLSIMADGSVKVNGADTGVDFVGGSFGYWFDNEGFGVGPQEVWFSDSALNTAGEDHMLAFQGKNVDTVQLPGYDPGLWTNNEWLLAWETGAFYAASDGDYDDVVVMVESVHPVVPLPGAVLLGMLGLGFAGRKLRKIC